MIQTGEKPLEREPVDEKLVDQKLKDEFFKLKIECNSLKINR